jgi:D-alanyl-D-alanine carboxypeptidase (penicillin-binding protein 5/6)
MLKAICIASANDCTYALAEFISGSEELFVQKMNEKAKELGMNNTSFKNCHGLDEDGHLTTSYDIALMSRELLVKHPEIKEYSSTWIDSLRDGSSELVNTNRLIRTYNGATGLKTGSTSLALYNLSASATRDNLSLIAVIMKAPTPKIRFSEAKLLLDYGFNTYDYKLIGKKEDIFTNLAIQKGTQNNIDLVFEKDFGVLIKKKNIDNLTQNIVINEEKMIAPIKKDEILGKIEYLSEGVLLGSVNLCSNVDIPKKSPLNYFNFICQNWLNFLR